MRVISWGTCLRMMAILLMLGMAVQSSVHGIHAEDAATPVVPTLTPFPFPPTPTNTPVPPTAVPTVKPSPSCARDDAYTARAGYILSVAAPGIFANDPGTYDLVAVGPVAHGSVTVSPDGGFSYVPAPGFVGTDAFVYELACVDGGHRYATVTITVLAGDPPTMWGCTPRNDVYSMPKNTSLTVPNPGLYGNDSYGTEIVSHSLYSKGDATHGTFSLNSGGGFVYTPDAGFVGREAFTYTIICFKADGTGFGQTATVTIEVGLSPVTPTPTPSCTLVDDAYTIKHDTTLTVGKPGVFANDSFSVPFSLAAVGTASHGTAAITADGTLTYAPNPGYAGKDEFTYSVRCGSGGDVHTTTATVRITVEGTSMFSPASTSASSER